MCGQVCYGGGLVEAGLFGWAEGIGGECAWGKGGEVLGLVVVGDICCGRVGVHGSVCWGPGVRGLEGFGCLWGCVRGGLEVGHCEVVAVGLGGAGVAVDPVGVGEYDA